MTSELTRERLQEIAEDGFLKHGESKELARMALGAMDREPVAWTDEEELRDANVAGIGYLFGIDREANKFADPRRQIMLYRHAQPAPEYPETLPCPVFLEPGLRFGKGVKTILVLEAIQRRAEHYAELEAMPPEERAEYDAGIEAFKAMLPQPAPALPDFDDVLESLDYEVRCNAWESEHVMQACQTTYDACRAAMLQELQKSAGAEATCRSNENVQVLHTKSPAQTDCCPAQNSVTPAQNQGWIPVSERMPEVGDIVLTAMEGVVNVGEMECSAANCRFFTSVISGRELPATHWMPLPAAPQEVNHG